MRPRGGHSAGGDRRRSPDAQCQPSRTPAPDPPERVRKPSCLHAAPGAGLAAPGPDARQAGQRLPAPEPGSQNGVRGRGLGEPPRVAAVFAVRVGGTGDAAPGRVDLVVGQAGAWFQAQRQERVPARPAHGVGSGPNASSSRTPTSGSGREGGNSAANTAAGSTADSAADSVAEWAAGPGAGSAAGAA